METVLQNETQTRQKLIDTKLYLSNWDVNNYAGVRQEFANSSVVSDVKPTYTKEYNFL